MIDTSQVTGNPHSLRASLLENGLAGQLVTKWEMAMFTLFKRAKVEEESQAAAAKMSVSGTHFKAAHYVETPSVGRVPLRARCTTRMMFMC